VEVEEHFENGWNFIFTKAGILTTSDLDMLSDLLILQGVPDCVFGNNTGVLYNDKLKFAFFINARDALHFCNFDNRKKHLLDR
jgi:type 2A phosphatase activator TIP41